VQVTLQLQRERGELRTKIGSVQGVTGRLTLNPRRVGDKQVMVLQLLEASRRVPDLYEPRATYIGGNEIRFIGYEKYDRAWMLQEWWCATVR
jgi:hypothetical protein